MDSGAFGYSARWMIWSGIIFVLAIGLVMFGLGTLVGWWLL